MPELPEVETIVARLKGLLVGKQIVAVQVLRDKSFQGNPNRVVGKKITQITRRAKLIRIHLESAQNLLIHLKMTGQLIFVDGDRRVGGGHPTADWVGELPSKHTRVVFDLLGNAKLYFNDMRVFGWIRLLGDAEIEREFQKYGPDVIDTEVTIEYLQTKFSKTSRPIKQVIMDNKIISGVGNIYASDALNLSRLSPFKPASKLTKDEIKKLAKSMKSVILLGIKTGGATIDNYRHVDGFSGSYQNHVLAYGREGKKCQQCGGEIVRKKIAGRSTFYCATCQS